MKFLYIDDSGKIHKNDPSRHFVLGGFSIDEGRWHAVVRQLSGAKANFLPSNGKPHEWELKGKDYLTSNAWKRSKRKGLCFEIANILERNHCKVYAVSLEKSKANDALDEEKFFPLAFQRLASKFYSEILDSAETGSIICDWSTYKMDHHTSNCILSLVVSNKMDLLRGGVTYGSSTSLVTLQVADLIAGTIRRSLEGQSHLDELAERFRSLRYRKVDATDVFGYPVDSISRMF